ncbi:MULTISPECIES: BrnT family toxin [Serratia]|nr:MULTISPECIES: BrnT family toxin [Serratia]MDM1839659.1 BrnT family toxin [Serratia marcescens]MDP8671662.1 BrnT family toxin [Serratia marcescens]MDP8696323.1 BrnT family toxin [Serratia marcescens]MDP8725986.1 BrnT family toxin [Serratia marcescens]UIM54740.1 BrnT family toxin [Serratia marcescens]
MYVYFEWNQDKNHSNQRKHRVSFEIAQRVFLDPNHLAVLERIEDGEERWQTIGMVGSCLLLLVAHTTIETDVEGDTVEIVRIISARKADGKERGRHEAQKFRQKSGP